MDHSFISFRSLFQKGHPTETATPTSVAYSLRLPGFVFLFGQEDMGGEAGRKINTSVAQQRGPAWTGDDTEPAPCTPDTLKRRDQCCKKKCFSISTSEIIC